MSLLIELLPDYIVLEVLSLDADVLLPRHLVINISIFFCAFHRCCTVRWVQFVHRAESNKTLKRCSNLEEV